MVGVDEDIPLCYPNLYTACEARLNSLAPQDEYTRRVAHWAAAITALDQVSGRISNLRLLTATAAIATAAGGAARGIVRISGVNALNVVAAMIEPTDEVIFGATNSTPTIHPAVIRSIPCDLYVWPTNRSYTRSPTVEIHTFGSPPLLQTILRAACAAGARIAQPGEFTLRAFLAGRLDLTQAEAVLGVIDAQGETELHTALGQLAGGLARPLHDLRSLLLDLLAELEAGLDFVEEDIEFISADALHTQIQQALQTTNALVQQVSSRSEQNELFRVVLVGSPNAGKSSLFNALVGESAAIVSPVSGTTRDYLSARITLGSDIAVELIDTAGFDESYFTPNDLPARSTIHSEAQFKTREQESRADLRLVCCDATQMSNLEPIQIPLTPTLSQRERGTFSDGILAKLPLLSDADRESTLIVLTKCDLVPADHLPESSARSDAIPTSCITGCGLDELRTRIQDFALSRRPSHVVSTTAIRCYESLTLARDCLQRAASLSRHPANEDFIAAEIRVSLVELGKVAGTVYTDDVLDRIFSRFCIGK